jgi:mono/diheme cytochrome c family protein
MKVQTTARYGAGVVMVALLLAACSDPNLQERRGYSKQPLERPGLIVQAEQPGEMARYGAPNRVVAERIQLAEQQPAPAPTAAAPVTRAPVQLPEGVTGEMVAQGEQLFGSTGNCFTCHAADGSGTPLAPAVNDANWIHIDGSFESLVQIIAGGVPVPAQYPAVMPPRGGAQITEEQVRQIAAYLYSISR